MYSVLPKAGSNIQQSHFQKEKTSTHLLRSFCEKKYMPYVCKSWVLCDLDVVFISSVYLFTGRAHRDIIMHRYCVTRIYIGDSTCPP